MDQCTCAGVTADMSYSRKENKSIVSTATSPGQISRSTEGFLQLEYYGALGDGRSVALTGADGSIDWWCVPNLDSPPLFDRLLDPVEGGYFSISPKEPFSVERNYRQGSNVLETLFVTPTGSARLVESLNSGTAGRLPWCELARRIEGIDGFVEFDIQLCLSALAGHASPYVQKIGEHDVFHVGHVLGLFLHSAGIVIQDQDDRQMRATLRIEAGNQELVAIVAGEDEPLVAPSIDEISERLDISDREWRSWTERIKRRGAFNEAILRHGLALKLLLYSPSGAIAAAATTSLPERMGGGKNWDYRFAWLRDAGYTINAFLSIGAQAEAKAAFTWLLKQIDQVGPRVCYALSGGEVNGVSEVDVPGYRASRPVVVGNRAYNQHQHGIFGDIFETAARFVRAGNILDTRSAQTLSRLGDQCADLWRQKDSGIWELPELQHYTMSKISCWQALNRAVELADQGQLPTTCRDRWSRERDRIEEWIDQNCWSDDVGAYVFYPGTTKLDASLALAVRFGFDGKDRLRKTMDAIDRKLGAGSFHYRFTGAEKEEGCFLACSFWVVEARALLGDVEQAQAVLAKLQDDLSHGTGIYPEMIDPKDRHFLGNLPQGLSHLAALQAMITIEQMISR